MTASTGETPRTIEQRLEEWLKQPGARITVQQLEFIEDMRVARKAGVGYGWMQQVIEWEWQAKGMGAHGPEYFTAEIDRLTKELSAAREQTIEECAKVCDEVGADWGEAGAMDKLYAAEYLSRSIRLLPQRAGKGQSTEDSK